jgi:UDP-N-acetylglucosamine/UDP-N-acetyl-alpha-D-glucosaminouronate 4-epimerase
MPIPDLQGVPVLVTGGAGFIGSHLVDGLLERGAVVRVLDDLSTGKRENLAHCRDRIDLIVGDIRNLQTCRTAADGVRVVFHQAALGSVPRSLDDPATTIAVNVSGTANVFAAARDARARRVIYASSSSVYGDSDRLPKREGEEGRPLSPYALSKVMNEQLATGFARCFGLHVVGLRYFNIFGPRQDPAGPYAAVVPRFFAAYAAGRPPQIHGDGEQSRDFTFVGDAVMANLLAAGADAAACGRSYNVAAGNRTSINALAKAIGALMGDAREPVHVAQRPGDVRHSLGDTSLARESLGFAASTNLLDGLGRLNRWRAGT